MADDDRNEHLNAADEEEEEEEDWSEPVDIAHLSDGPRTFFLGGFSLLRTLDEAVAALTQPDDALVVLPGRYAGDLTVDDVRMLGMMVRGDARAGRGAVVVEGRLVVEHSAAAAAPRASEASSGAHHEGEADDEADEQAAQRTAAPPQPLHVAHATFAGGAEFATQTTALIDDVVFGVADRSVVRDYTVVAHGFSKVSVVHSTVFGTSRAAVYGFPRTGVVLEECEIIGAQTPAPAVEGTRTVRKRGAPPPPPPPPTTPSQCECAVGIFLDNASATFTRCSVRNFNIGIFATDVCPNSRLEGVRVSLVATVGVLLEEKVTTALRACTVTLCGRECLVVGTGAHPSIRGSTFVGSVRLKRGSIATGIAENVVGCNGAVLVEDGTFTIGGLQVVAHDPTAPKIRRAPKEDTS